MKEIVSAYILYLSKFKGKQKPKMPNISPAAYNDVEYTLAIDGLNADFDNLDSLAITEHFLKG